MTNASHPLMIAVEGPCFAGKTSLISQLTKILPTPVGVAPDYSELHGTRKSSPPPHASIETELQSLRTFVAVDELRVREAKCLGGSIILFDRCYHTLLAHVYAECSRYGPAAFTAAKELVLNKRCYVADKTILLDVRHSELRRRADSCDHGTPPFFLGTQYVRQFYAYFADNFVDRPTSLIRLDGERPSAFLTGEVIRILKIR